jgi:hypothetical protein
MDETIISWNVPNWITIVLMAFLGFAVVGFATKLLLKAKGGGDA